MYGLRCVMKSYILNCVHKNFLNALSQPQYLLKQKGKTAQVIPSKSHAFLYK